MSLKHCMIIIITLLMTIAASAQDNLAAVIEIRYEGVELRRENSDVWLPLPQYAVAFIGAGDTIRTDEQGRVQVSFDESTHLLLLSNSELTLTTLASDTDTLSLEAMLIGNAIFETSSDNPFDPFNLVLNDLTITDPALLMGIWSFTDATDAVTVAQGNAIVLMNDISVDVPAETGFFAEPERSESIAFDPEWHAAGLEARLYGCEGVVQTAGDTPLLVRTGPGRGFQPMGTLDVSRIVPLMATTATTGWTRIQFLTGFGWIQSLAIESDCTDLPVVPDDSPEEKFVTIINVTDDELSVLRPFIDSPANNAFVYQFVFDN